MLKLFKYLPPDVWQCLEEGEKAEAILRAIEGVAIATNAVQHNVLIFYYRYHSSCGTYEAGICYGPGRHCSSKNKFLVKVLRLFSKEENVRELLGGFYIKFVEKKGFHYLKFMKSG